MGDLFLDRGKLDDSTSISNYFIEEYMPKANGEFVKIYIYLIRCASSATMDLSLEKIADVFSCTERDITRALRYWENLGLLSLTTDTTDKIKGICLEGCKRKNKKEVANSITIHTDNSAVTLAPKPKYSSKDLLAFKEHEEVELLLFSIETYLGKTLSATDVNTILYFHDTLGFSIELIEYLFEYCVDNHKKNMRYIETVALKWAEDGIFTIEQAKANTSLYSKKFYPVMKSMGIYDRSPGASEREYIVTWTDRMGFTTDIIIEACKRTIDSIHKPDFRYANSILENWKKQGILSISDIQKLDQEHKNKTLEAKLKKNNKPAVQKNSFHNFDQRTYDFDELEKELLSYRP